ncbi:FHA domain-containing protein [Diplocarpon rosae]|nr:FHA domain-containing protein [Diplocarpon rosae]
MWILDCEGDTFQGRKQWLRPGKKYIFGRNKTEDVQYGLADKTVSRLHLLVVVDSVEPSTCANARFRTQITLTDGCGVPNKKSGEFGTSVGTLLNGEQIRGKAVVLQRDQNVVILGKFKQHFHFNWVPVTFTFSFTTKELKANPFPALHERLGPLDIRVLQQYEREYVTHVVAKKRNTSKGLQALINGKYIVHNDSFVEAIVSVATRLGGEPSLLEFDYEAHFPDPLKYLPPQGEEPTQRSAEAYAPVASRIDVFDGYTFVFYSQQQFTTLLAPITEGRGKALLREAIPEKTTVEEFVRYVKGVADEKGLGEFEEGSEGKGVVVVKFNPAKGPGTAWFAEFGTQVSLSLGHRLIEQSEFLDAILGNDASVLRRPILDDASSLVAPPPIAGITPQTIQNFEEVEKAPPEPVRGRRRARAKFTGFEDDFSGPIAPSTPVPESEPMQIDEPPPGVIQYSQSLFVSQDPDWEIPQAPEPEVRSSRKRHVSPMSDDEDIHRKMVSQVTASKRRRLAETANCRHGGEVTPPSPLPQSPLSAPNDASKEEPVAKGKFKRLKKERKIDILEPVRQQREQAEAAAKAKRELREEKDSCLNEQVRNLAIIEVMEVKRSKPAPQRTRRADESQHWEPRWATLKNFKRFRRRPDSDDARGFDKVIVPLVEVKRKDFGIGDMYWQKDESQRKKKGKEVGKDAQDVSRMESQRGPQNRASEAARIILSNKPKDAFEEVAVPEEVVSDSDLQIVTPAPKARTSRADPQQKLADQTIASQDRPTGQKRIAATTLTKPAPAKKARQTMIRKLPRPEESDDDDSDDGLRFRFKK